MGSKAGQSKGSLVEVSVRTETVFSQHPDNKQQRPSYRVTFSRGMRMHAESLLMTHPGKRGLGRPIPAPFLTVVPSERQDEEALTCTRSPYACIYLSRIIKLTTYVTHKVLCSMAFYYEDLSDYVSSDSSAIN